MAASEPSLPLEEAAVEAAAPLSTHLSALEPNNEPDNDTAAVTTDAHGGDSDSDISMEADSEDEDNRSAHPAEHQPPAGTALATSGTPTQTNDGPLRKRKSLADPSGLDHHLVSFPETKKVKLQDDGGEHLIHTHHLPADRSRLPAEIWHHIFTFCQPQTLGALLRVNKAFNSYLDPAASQPHEQQPEPSSQGLAQILKPNSIWRASRRTFLPNMPSPLRNKTELDMWRMACSLVCAHCGKLSVGSPSVQPDPSHPGPGMDGVSIIWPFATQSCGPCLLKNSVKVSDNLVRPAREGLFSLT